MVIRSGRAAALLSIGLGASAAWGQAPPPRIELRWQAPAECPDDLGLLRGVEGFLGQSLAQAREQELAIQARVQGDAEHGYAAKLSFVSAQGATERALEHPDCDKLTEAAALLVALAIDPERVRAHQQVGAPVQSGESEPIVAPVPPPPLAERTFERPPPPAAGIDRGPASEQDPSDQPARFSLAILGLAGGGMLPSVAPGVGVELALRLGPFEAALGGRSWAARNAAVPETPGSSVELSLITGGLRLCGVPTRGPWSVLACARGDFGDMSGHGQQVNNARTRHDRFAALGGSLGGAYAVGRFSPRAGAELLWTAARPRFGVLSEGREIEAFRPQVWHLAGFIGLAYAL